MSSGKFNLIVNQISKTEEREEHYLFSAEPYEYSPTVLVFKKGRTDITGARDLPGKSVLLSSTVTTYGMWLEQFNKENGNKISIHYAAGDADFFFSEIANGHYDAIINSPFAVDYYAKERGAPVDSVVITEIPPDTLYIVIAKTAAGQALKPKIDAALRELCDDGTLSRLSIQFLGKDYTVPPSQK